MILITGADGFIGTHLSSYLFENGYEIVFVKKAPDRKTPDFASREVICRNIAEFTGWQTAFQNVDTVVHLAGIAHKKNVSNKEFEATNVNATADLIKSCAAAKVKKFVFLSSIGVLSEGGSVNLTNRTLPKPESEYAKSKLRAEIVVKELCKEFQINYTIIRPPLVYGDGAKGNFQKLTSFAVKNLPCPSFLGQVTRSFVGVTNLCDFIFHCIESLESKNQTLVVSDGADLTIKDFIKAIKLRSNKRYFELPISKEFIHFASLFLSKGSDLQKLSSNLTIDLHDTKEKFNWAPQIEPAVDIGNMVDGFLERY
jgi:nucleoside-diphosphate-sugar epimerase